MCEKREIPLPHHPTSPAFLFVICLMCLFTSLCVCVRVYVYVLFCVGFRHFPVSDNTSSQVVAPTSSRDLRRDKHGPRNDHASRSGRAPRSSDRSIDAASPDVSTPAVVPMPLTISELASTHPNLFVSNIDTSTRPASASQGKRGKSKGSGPARPATTTNSSTTESISPSEEAVSVSAAPVSSRRRQSHRDVRASAGSAVTADTAAGVVRSVPPPTSAPSPASASILVAAPTNIPSASDEQLAQKRAILAEQRKQDMLAMTSAGFAVMVEHQEGILVEPGMHNCAFAPDLDAGIDIRQVFLFAVVGNRHHLLQYHHSS
jgi:hypothetical protein